MDKTRSTPRNQKRHSSSTKKRLKKGCMGPWSDLNNQVLYSIMMQLGVIDFVAFSGVCQSWRSLALSNRDKFMASRPPMSMLISYRPYKKECYLEDFEGRKFKTLIPHSAGRFCVGLTSGYLILFSYKIYDYWLVNPITRHELHFPCRHNIDHTSEPFASRAVLVFSPSISKWVFVTSQRYTNEIWFSTEGQGSWNHVDSTFCIYDLHAFKGKIYTLNTSRGSRELEHVCELSFNPEPKLTILETVILPNTSLNQEFVSSGENLFVVESISDHEYNIHELDVDEIKWVCYEKTNVEYAVFLSNLKSSAAVKPTLWADHWSRRFVDSPLSGKVRLCTPKMWYFPMIVSMLIA